MSQQNKKTNAISEGFTLIELLVVIAIIAVLAGALLIAINPQSMIQKGRDSKRLQDMDTLVKAINLALADSEILLSAGTEDSINGTAAVGGGGYVAYTIPTGKTGLSKFIPTLPVDPLNDTTTGDFFYNYSSDGTNFEVNALFEHADNLLRMGTDGGNDPDIYEIGTDLTII